MRIKEKSSAWGRNALLLFALLICIGIAVADKASPRGNSRELSRKLFLKGAVMEAEGKQDAAYEYYKKAYQTDTSNADAAFAYGSSRIYLAHDTLGSTEEQHYALGLMRKLTDAYPADLFSSLPYAYLAFMTEKPEEAIRIYEILEKKHPTRSALPAYKADVYASMGMTDSAVSAMRRYERLEGVSFESTVRKARYHLIAGDTTSVINEMTTLVDAHPGQAEFIAAKARMFQLLEMPDSAFKYYLEAQRVDPKDGGVMAELAEFYAEKGDSAEYDRLTYEALLSDNLIFEIKMDILANYLQKMVSDNADASRSDYLLEQINRQYPHEPALLEINSRYYAARNRFEDAIEQLRYARDLDPEAQYNGIIQTYYYLDKNYDEAIKTYLESLADTTSTLQMAFVYMNCMEETGHPDKALDVLDSLINERAPGVSLYDTVINRDALRSLSLFELTNVANFYEMGGDIYFRLDSLDKAYQCYENSLTLDPENALALNNYAYFLVDKSGVRPGNPLFDKARDMIEQCIVLTKEQPSATYLDTYAWILFLDKQYQKAEEVQRKALELALNEGSESAEIYSHLGDILFFNGNPEEALEQWKKALEFEPDNKLLKKKVQHKAYFAE